MQTPGKAKKHLTIVIKLGAFEIRAVSPGCLSDLAQAPLPLYPRARMSHCCLFYPPS